jgi:hypothetical protein
MFPLLHPEIVRNDDLLKIAWPAWTGVNLNEFNTRAAHATYPHAIEQTSLVQWPSG